VASLRDLLEIRVALPANFSPDGRWLAVLANLTGVHQLYRLPVVGGELEQLTDLSEPVSGGYLPVGDRLLVLRDEGGNERHQLYLLDAEPGAELEPLVVEPEFLHVAPCISRDGRLLAYGCNRRNGRDLDVYVRSLEDASERCVLSLGGWCEPSGFSPDERWLAVGRVTERSGDSDLYLVDVESGEVVHASPHDDEAVFGAPAWLADCSTAYVPASTGRDTVGIARYDPENGTLEYVIEDDWDLWCWIDQAGRSLLVDANEGGYSRLELRDPVNLQVRTEVPLPGRGVVANTAFSRDGRYLAYHFTSPLEPGDVWLYDVETGGLRRVTNSPRAVAPEELVDAELHRFASFDGESIPAFLFRPDTDGPAPVVVEIHGGPESQRRPIFMPVVQYLVQNGYAVVQPNVRGSTGYGKRYEHLDDVERRLDSVRDLTSLHDWLATDVALDASRVVLYGGSYGGYMVLAGLAFHPERWAAGISVVGISSFVTFLENTSEWRRYFREREYGSLERDRNLLRDVSPLTHVDRIVAPLFLIHGANDPRVPVSEAKQIHGELIARGIPCELLVYDDEGHGLQKLTNRLDAYPKAIAFLEQVLEGAPVGR
jgi:dipeptidyl aminopeptidase/acylaminoacyl peptidase